MQPRLLAIIALAASLGAAGCHSAPKQADVAAMTQTAQAVDALRAAYAAFNRGDLDAAVASFDPQIEWTEPAEFPGGGAYHGRDAVKQYLAQSRAGAAQVISRPEQFIAVRDKIVVFVFARVLPKDSSEWKTIRLADVYTIRDGKIVAMHAFANRDEALRWAEAKTSD
ncbi:MAG TPA: nuclear transport factor 2 family protein [Verrucomicrobiae bacterium]|nr:nuclear transport factor 2 family protein [Verrucomicrobiae bacterium]